MITNIIVLLAVGALGLFIKKFLPSYIDEKGKNLATKQDIADITRKTEEVQDEFKKGLENFKSDLNFKYDFYYKQYSKLYSKLYGIIIQSEYIRHFFTIRDKKDYPFDDYPFLEVSSNELKIKRDFISGEIISKTKEKIETPISQFNKKQLCDYIIENAEYATQELLKIAISYRFAYAHYEGNPDSKNSTFKDTANEEELRLIREMVCCIVKDYNFFREHLNMDYDKSEHDTGIMQLK